MHVLTLNKIKQLVNQHCYSIAAYLADRNIVFFIKNSMLGSKTTKEKQYLGRADSTSKPARNHQAAG